MRQIVEKEGAKTMKITKVSFGLVLVAGLILSQPALSLAKDKDNNPPGPKGGPGTNWENPPGPKGGQGASPDVSQVPGHVFKTDKADLNHDGVVDPFEKKKAIRHWKKKHHPKMDKDNNPPGPKGGPGTNWENPAGPVGGPGASPDKPRYRYDKDNNPPGPKGGPGTNWENPPGPKGGPGASPNRHK